MGEIPNSEPTLGEVHRLLTRIDGELAEHRTESRTELSELRGEVRDLRTQTARNATISAAFGPRLDSLDREMRDLKHQRAKTPASNEAEVKELVDLARDVRGAVRFGKVIWGLLGGGIGVGLIWLLFEKGFRG
jgi:chromosome segregation ATPase